MRKESLKKSLATWLECANWLNSCGVLNMRFCDRLHSHELTISDLAHALHDGIVLCSLMNRLVPGSIDTSQITANKSIASSRFSCIKNIKLFLDACKQEFSMTDEQLFEPSMLYELHIERVISALSIISKLIVVEKATKMSGFENIEEEHAIYDEIVPVEDEDEDATLNRYYLPANAIIGSNDSFYETILGKMSIKLESRDFLVREIYNTEKRFVEALITMIEDFIGSLSVHLDEMEMKIVFINVESLYKFHSELLLRFKEAIDGRAGRTSRICEVLNSARVEMLNLYTEYFIGYEASKTKIQSLCFKNDEFKDTMENCCRNPLLKNIKLNDLLILPFQHVLRYHLLLNSLYEKTSETHAAKKLIYQTLSNMVELSNFLNEVKRDQESLDQIVQVSFHLKGFRFQTNGLSEIPEALANEEDHQNQMPSAVQEIDDSVIYDEPPDESNEIYTSSNAIFENLESIFSTTKVGQRDWQIRQLLFHEVRFVNILKVTVHYFMNQLSMLNDTDKHTIFINIDLIEKLHSELLHRLREAIAGEEGRTSRVCRVFEEMKDDLTNTYSYYTLRLGQSQERIRYLLEKNDTFRTKIDECRHNSGIANRLKFQDLIASPCVHVLKYKLYFMDMKKETDDQHSAKNDLESTIQTLDDLGFCLNEIRRNKKELNPQSDLTHFLPYYTQTCLKEYGHLIRDDKIRVKEQSDILLFKTRVVFLFDKALFLCKSVDNSYLYKKALLLNEYALDEVTGTANSWSSLQQLHLVNRNDRKKSYLLHFKTNKQFEEWRKLISSAIEKILPSGHDSNGHLFKLTNFGRELTSCSLCSKELKGIFFQGYKCTNCSLVAHKACITRMEKCASAGAVAAMSAAAARERNSSIDRNSIESNRRQFKAYTANALYPYRGKPAPPEFEALKFNTHDYIVITDDDDDDWWKGYRADDASKIEGYFPSRYVQNIYVPARKATINQLPTRRQSEQSTSLDQYSWYVNCNRDYAITILERIPSPPHRTIFLVRPSDDGFSISIKYRSEVKRLKVNEDKTSSHRGNKYILAAGMGFNTLPELIAYYMHNSLVETFQDLNTTLGMPYRDALPTPQFEVVAIKDYDDKNISYPIKLIKEQKYWVMSKDNRPLWKIFNTDGLIGYAPANYLREVL